MSETVTPATIEEVMYQVPADNLQVWIRWGRPSYNEHVRDGLYRVLDLETDELLGWEIVTFKHYVSKHGELAALAEAFERLPGDAVIWRRPANQTELRRLIGIS